MITAAGSEPGPGGVGPGGDPHRMRQPQWRRPEQGPHAPGQRRPSRTQWPGRPLAEQPVCLSGKFLGTAQGTWRAGRSDAPLRGSCARSS